MIYNISFPVIIIFHFHTLTTIKINANRWHLDVGLSADRAKTQGERCYSQYTHYKFHGRYDVFFFEFQDHVKKKGFTDEELHGKFLKCNNNKKRQTFI